MANIESFVSRNALKEALYKGISFCFYGKMTIPPIAKPELRTYLDIHQYLEDLYRYRKQTEVNFSYETWAQELDIKNRSYLRQIVIGRRSITESTIKLLCDRLNFQGADREYFNLLVLYSKSRNQDQRNLYGRKLMQLLKSDYEQIEIQNYFEFVSTPLFPQLLTLLSFKDIDRSTQGLALLLKRSVGEIENTLLTLQRLKLAQKEGDSLQWQTTNHAFKVPDHLGSVALSEYHKQSLQEAIKAVRLPREQRRYKSLLLPLSGEEFSEFLEDLQTFVKQSLRKFDTNDLQRRRLHQVNFNIYSVTDEPNAHLEIT